MDLRPFCRTEKARAEAARVLNYQPFIIADDIQTGAAPSWLYGMVHAKSGVPGDQFVFCRDQHDGDWDKITAANARMRRMYDDMLAEIAQRFKGGSLLDLGCNNGYFPIGATRLGMRGCVGADGDGTYAKSIAFLNQALGTAAQFIQAYYDPRAHAGQIAGRYDVVCASAVMCHQPDPVNFLAYLGSLAAEAVFYFGQLVDTDELMVSYSRPHPSLGAQEQPFPFRFNDNSRLSRGLFYYGCEEMGFRTIVELPWRDVWLPPHYRLNYAPPRIDSTGERLDFELKNGSRHFAILAMR